MALEPLVDDDPVGWHLKVNELFAYWDGSAAPSTFGAARTEINAIASALDLPTMDEADDGAVKRIKINAVMAAADYGLGTRILEILGSKALMQIDPWGRQDLTVESAGAISQITGSASGVVFSQAVSASRPAPTNGTRNVPKGDGVDDYLETLSMAWAKQENYSLYGVARGNAPYSTGSTTLFSFGSNVNTGPRIIRQGSGGSTMYIRATVGTGAANIQSDFAVAAEWPGSVTFWIDVKPTEFDFYVNNVLVGTYAAVPSMTATRARIFSAQGNSPGAFGAMNLGLIGFSDLATSDERNAIAPLLNAIAINLQAA